MLAAGSRLGPYEILAPIGAGGMGEVYRARDPRLDRLVAVKILPPSFSNDADRLARFEQEARTAGALNHPNVLSIYDVGQHEGAPYLVSELLEGESLRDKLKASLLPVRKTIDYAVQIARGLAAAHESGIVHRDLKPENVYVTKAGRVKILDFGLAKFTRPEPLEPAETSSLEFETPLTRPGVLLGTVSYMSPEQVLGAKVDQRSDIFSFGTMVHEMLSGKRPFYGSSPIETMNAILKQDPSPLHSRKGPISLGLERLVRHCLEKNIEERFHSAHDLAFDLETLSEPSVAGTVITSPPPRLWSWRAAMLLGLGAALASSIWFALRKADPSPPTFRRLTFRRGYIDTARFAPDGQSVAYAAAWDGNPLELLSSRLDGVESRALGIRDASILAISRSAEVALNIRPHGRLGQGTLARLPLAGGSPREILEGAVEADWSSDGRQLAVTRVDLDGMHLEFPIGKVVDQARFIQFPRVAPNGKLAYWEEFEPRKGLVMLMDSSGTKRKLANTDVCRGLAWSPDAKEIWFVTVENEIRAVSLSGKERRVLSLPGDMHLDDISRDGRVLLRQGVMRRSWQPWRRE